MSFSKLALKMVNSGRASIYEIEQGGLTYYFVLDEFGREIEKVWRGNVDWSDPLLTCSPETAITSSSVPQQGD
jgi:hypothetical protein